MLSTKKEVLLALMAAESSAFIHFDPRNSSVMVPTYLEKQAQCVLQVGWNMPVPIGQLSLDAEGLHGIFSFKGMPHPVFVPYERMFAIIGADTNRGRVFHEAIPEEIRKLLAETSPSKPELDTDTQPAEAPPRSNVFSLDAYKQRKMLNGRGPNRAS
jgi:stringent starvation protein B